MEEATGDKPEAGKPLNNESVKFLKIGDVLRSLCGEHEGRLVDMGEFLSVQREDNSRMPDWPDQFVFVMRP